MPRTPRSYRLFQRSGRWYARYYGFDALLGPNPRLAMVAPGERYATGDKDLAKEIAEAKLEELRATRLTTHEMASGSASACGTSSSSTSRRRKAPLCRSRSRSRRSIWRKPRRSFRGMRTGEDVDVASISVDDVRRYVFLLTGGRKSEVFGLAIDDVNVERKTITFRPHPWRRLKTLTSHRVVPLWPQLEKILRD